MISNKDIIRAMQAGLKISKTPYKDAAKKLGMDEKELHKRLYSMMDEGTIRRIGLVPNHFKLGYTFNAMTVWDIDDDIVDDMGEQFGQQDYVSHCYRRPAFKPQWPYNLFAMVHGRSQQEVDNKIDKLKKLSGGTCYHSDVLFSEKILKKTGLRLVSGDNKNA
jgi:DNA-binding Lrp family transcriptional regulator